MSVGFPKPLRTAYELKNSFWDSDTLGRARREQTNERADVVTSVRSREQNAFSSEPTSVRSFVRSLLFCPPFSTHEDPCLSSCRFARENRKPPRFAILILGNFLKNILFGVFGLFGKLRACSVSVAASGKKIAVGSAIV